MPTNLYSSNDNYHPEHSHVLPALIRCFHEAKKLRLKEVTCQVVGYEGDIKWDVTCPNGTPRKLFDVSKVTKLGWTYKPDIEDSIRLAYKDFVENPMREER